MSYLDTNQTGSKKRSAGANETDAPDAFPTAKRFCSSVGSAIGPLIDAAYPRQNKIPALHKRPIGQPVVFPDGIGTNYTRFSRFRGRSPSTERSSSSSSTVSSSRSANLQTDADMEHRSRQVPTAKTFLPPRHRRPRDPFSVTECVKLDGQSVILHDLPQDVTEKQIEDLVEHFGFKAQVTISVAQYRFASLEFLHSHVASAACSILQQRHRIVWDRIGSANDSLQQLEAEGISEVIDLTEETDAMSTLENLSILNTFEDDPYRNLSKDVYEQDGDSDSSDMSTSPPPHGRRSPGKEPASPTIGHVQDHLAAHLRNCFELPDSRTKTNNEIKKTRLQVRQDKASTSRITLPTPRDASRNDKLETYIVALPKSPHNKPRRVLLSKNSADAPIITVSMRGDVQFFDRNKWHRISRFSRPNDSVYRHVVDATIVGATAIIGYGNGPSQISLVRLSEGSSPLLVDLEQNHPHKVSLDSGSKTGKGAISCLAAKKSIAHITQFFTGGHDKTLRLWSVGDANLVTSEKLTTLTTIPEALGVRDRSLIVGTSRKILTVDLGHLSSIPTSAQLSNSVCQIHIHSQAPNVTILEVNSLDFQVQIFDDRKKQGFDRVADCYFGARQARTLARSTRGDTDFSMFVKGYEDGTVRMWDFRNSKKPILTKKYEDIGSVVHTVFAGPNIICYGENNLTFIDISGGTI